MATREKPLYRSEIRQRSDRPTSSVILQYTGRRLKFDAEIYGYPEGTFFVASPADVPWPPELEEAAAEACVVLETLPEARDVRDATVEALVTEAAVHAPELLADMAEPRVYWNDWDRRELERKHMIAARHLQQLTSAAVRQVMVRGAHNIPCPEPAPQAPELPPPSAGAELALPGRSRREDAPVVPPSRVPDAAPAAPAAAEEDTSWLPTSVAVHRARDAVVAAREAELPQRLPGGARRRLKRMPPGVYIAHGSEAIDPRANMSAAMADAQAKGTKGNEAVVIDWDGEWPVVVRRYGQGGRTIYKVEDALRRAGIEVTPDEPAEVGT